MSDDLPPPYYTAVATLEPEHRDAASHIRELSNNIVKTSKDFNDVRNLLESYTVQVAPSSLNDQWRAHRQVFTNIIWAARDAATMVQTRNKMFLEVNLPLVGDDNISNEAKIKQLERFCASQPPTFLTSKEAEEKLQAISNAIPGLLKEYEESADKMIDGAKVEIARLEAERDKQKASEVAPPPKKSGHSWFSSRPAAAPPPPVEHVAYDSMIAEQKEKIEAVNNQRGELKSKLADIRFALNTIPEQVGQSFWAVWTHLTNDATHLKNRLAGSTSDPMPDLGMVVRVYREINDALKYYATNVNNM